MLPEITDALWERPEGLRQSEGQMDFLALGAGVLDSTLAAHRIVALKIERKEGAWRAAMRTEDNDVRVSAAHETPGQALVDLLGGGPKP